VVMMLSRSQALTWAIPAKLLTLGPSPKKLQISVYFNKAASKRGEMANCAVRSWSGITAKLIRTDSKSAKRWVSHSQTRIAVAS